MPWEHERVKDRRAAALEWLVENKRSAKAVWIVEFDCVFYVSECDEARHQPWTLNSKGDLIPNGPARRRWPAIPAV